MYHIVKITVFPYKRIVSSLHQIKGKWMKHTYPVHTLCVLISDRVKKTQTFFFYTRDYKVACFKLKTKEKKNMKKMCSWNRRIPFQRHSKCNLAFHFVQHFCLCLYQGNLVCDQYVGNRDANVQRINWMRALRKCYSQMFQESSYSTKLTKQLLSSKSIVFFFFVLVFFLFIFISVHVWWSFLFDICRTFHISKCSNMNLKA